MSIFKIFTNAICVGIATVVVGLFVGFVIRQITPHKKYECVECKDWNKYHVMEISLFFTGFFVYVIAELFGVNTMYCKSIKKVVASVELVHPASY